MVTEPTFSGFPGTLEEGKCPRVVIFGAGHGSTYPGHDSHAHAGAARAVRLASLEDASLVDHWDFDLGGPLFGDEAPCCIDVGDLPTRMSDNVGNRILIETKTREILSHAGIPLLLGGDDSVVPPFLEGFADHGPIWIVQIDAHIDWRDEVHGELYGYSSPMRRASEMAHVAGIVQVGIRGVGSARANEVADARAYGSRIVTAREVHARGIEAALSHIPDGARVVMTVDCDGLDPGIMPGVAAPSPGGLTYTQIIDLIAGIGRRCTIAGFDIVELYPPADVGGLSALTAARLVVNALGAMHRQG